MGSKIISIIKQIPHKTYVEPFAGGCAVLFKKPQYLINNHVEVINDKSDLLVNLYRQFQTNFKEFYRRIYFTLYSESEHRKAKKILDNPNHFNDMDKAWAYYTSISQSFGYILNNTWSISKTSNLNTNTWQSKKNVFKEIHNRFSNIQIFNRDAFKIMETFNDKDTLFYIDPPYPNCDQGHYGGYTQKDFVSLINILKQTKSSFILSNYKNDAVPKDWRFYTVNASVQDGKGQSSGRVEYLWVKNNSL